MLSSSRFEKNMPSRVVSARPVGDQACCAVVVYVPGVNCGASCIKNHRHTADYNVGRFLKQLQTQLFDVHKRQYPIVAFHTDLKTTQRRILRGKTRSPVMFHKINLNPMALPMNLRPMFAAIVNATKGAHENGNLFLPEKAGATFRGFQQRMLSRFYAGEMMVHKALKGYKYVLRFDATDTRITSAFSYDPFARAQMLKSVFTYRSTTLEATTVGVNALLHGWMDDYSFSGKLLKPFVYKTKKGQFFHDGRAYDSSMQMFKMQAFQGSSLYKSMFEQVDKTGLFLLGDTKEHALTEGQFLSLVIPFLASSSPETVTEFTDVPIQYPVDLDEPYTQ